MKPSHAAARLPALLLAGRLEFDFDGVPLHARGLTVRRRANLLRSGLGHLLRLERMPGLPPVVQVEPTNLCDLRCPLCPTGAGTSRRAGGMMSRDTFERLMDEAGDTLILAILYGWGEPFLHPELTRMIARCTEQSVLSLVSTNGQHVQTLEEALAVVDAGLSALIIAMDGCRQETYESYRRGGDLEKVKRCVRLVEEAKRRRRSDRPCTCLRAVASRRNETELPEIRRFAREAGVDIFSTKSLGCLAESDAYSQFETAQEATRRYGAEGRSGQPVRCPYPFRQPTLFWDGTVVGCEFDYNLEDPWGRLGERSFRQIWNSSPARRQRRAVLDGARRPAFCELCPYRGRHGGGSALEVTPLQPPAPPA
ncbi:MAG: radical SAM protein [Candidatus Brocadiia bacterium]